MSFDLPRKQYADLYGPTTGDRVRLGDTNLVAEVPRSTAPAGAKTVSVSIADQTGQSVAGHIHVDGHGETVEVPSLFPRTSVSIFGAAVGLVASASVPTGSARSRR